MDRQLSILIRRPFGEIPDFNLSEENFIGRIKKSWEMFSKEWVYILVFNYLS
jgi:hypothetical protein